MRRPGSFGAGTGGGCWRTGLEREGVAVRKRKALSPEHCGSKEDVIDLPGPNTCTSGLWVLIPSRLEGEVVSELNTLRVGCVYPPCTTEREVRKEPNKQGQGPSPCFFQRKAMDL